MRYVIAGFDPNIHLCNRLTRLVMNMLVMQGVLRGQFQKFNAERRMQILNIVAVMQLVIVLSSRDIEGCCLLYLVL